MKKEKNDVTNDEKKDAVRNESKHEHLEIEAVICEQEYEKKKEAEKSAKQRILDYLIITAASFVYAVGVSLFIDPNNLAPGGVTGIAIILNRIIPVETGSLILIINIPILLLGIYKFGFRFIVSTFYTILMTSVFTNLLAPFGPATNDILLASLTGSFLTAISIGAILKRGATTGGTDIIIKCLRLRFPHMKTGGLFFITDVIVVTLSAVVFKDIDAALYAGIAIVVMSLLLDIVLYGRDGAKLLYIISDYSVKISERVLEELDVGVTYMKGKGAYSGIEKQVILCVVRKSLAPHVEDIVRHEDPEAFMIVSSATEIFGEGYKSYFSDKI